MFGIVSSHFSSTDSIQFTTLFIVQYYYVASPPPPESVRTAFARSYADVITKFSRLDGLPFFITHGALLARAQAPLTKDNTDMSRTVKPSLYVLNAFGKKRKKRKMIFYEDVSYITGDPDVEYD